MHPFYFRFEFRRYRQTWEERQQSTPKTNTNATRNMTLNTDRFLVPKICFYFEHRDLNTTKSLLESVIQIGRINSLQVWSNSGCTYGIIQFEHPEHAAQLLIQSNQIFAGSVVRFWKAQNRPICDNILNLNDDCLQEIFGFLDVQDLWSIAQINERFEDNAKSIFPLKYKSFVFGDTDESKKFMRNYHQLANFVKKFGSFIVELYIDYRQLKYCGANRVWELFVRYSSIALKELHFIRFNLNGAILSTILPLFGRFTSLDLEECDLSDPLIDSLRFCRQLERLRISCCDSDCRLLQFNFPKLESIRFNCCGGFNQRQMETFLEYNPQLKEVMIYGCAEIDDNMLSVIGNHLARVEKVYINLENTFQVSLDQNAFRSLKKLKIESCHGVSLAIVNMAAANIPLQSLHLVCPLDHQLVAAISDIKSIKSLVLEPHSNVYLNISQCLHICENLTELSDFYFGFCRGLNSTGLLNIVRTAKKLQTLHLISFKINNAAYENLLEILISVPLEI